MFFGQGRRVEKAKMTVIQNMTQMVQEADRVYRNLVQLYSTEFRATEPSGRGLFKARLHTAVMGAYAFALRWPDRHDDALELMNIGSGAALEHLVNAASRPHLDQQAARSIGLDYMKQLVPALADEFRNGPSDPARQTQGFRRLVELYHEAVTESVDSAQYTQPVRQRLDHLIVAGIGAGVRHVADVAQSL